jgi:hypothetical protein
VNRRAYAFGALLAFAGLTVACRTSPADPRAAPRSQIIGGRYDTVALCIREQLDASGRVWLMGAGFMEDQAARRARIWKRGADPLAVPGAVKPYSGRADPWETEVFSGPPLDWEIEVAQAGANVEILTRTSIEGGTERQSSFLQEAIARCAGAPPPPPPSRGSSLVGEQALASRGQIAPLGVAHPGEREIQ